MKKFLLVTFIGMVLVMNLYGIVNNIIENLTVEEQVDNLYKTVTIVYEE